MKSCEKCRFRAKYDKNPRSLLGRIWKWHIGWCPGWRSYLKSLSVEEKDKMDSLYGKLKDSIPARPLPRKAASLIEKVTFEHRIFQRRAVSIERPTSNVE